MFKQDKKFTLDIYPTYDHGFFFLMNVSHELTSLHVLCLSFIPRANSPTSNAINWYKISLFVFPKVGKTIIRTQELEKWAEEQLSFTG
jgi:hypothetical protein